VVVDDWAQTKEGETVDIPVLANDLDMDSTIDASTLSYTQPAFGEIDAYDPNTGVITYDPGPHYNGQDSFAYGVCDDGVPPPPYEPDLPACSVISATVTITTAAVPDRPVAVAAAYPQTAFSYATVTLDGSGSSDVDGDELSYIWYHGHSVSLSDPTAVRPTFTAPYTPTILTFSLSVSDGVYQSETPATVTVTVKSRPPVADAGPDQYVSPGDPVVLSGAGSTDPEGDVALQYVWAQIGGPTVAFTPTQEVVVFSAPPISTTLVFRLYVYDTLGTHDSLSSTDEVRVHIGDPPTLYFPQVLMDCKPDLAVKSLTITPDNVVVTIANQGCAPLRDWFYVDAYVNPDPTVALTVDDNWWDPHQPGSEPFGIKWQVTPSNELEPLWPGHLVAQLDPGDTIVLDQSNMLTTQSGRSRVPPSWSPGSVVWTQVDTYQGGRITEIDEQNNLAGPAWLWAGTY
jgi:hypothetical protein